MRMLLPLAVVLTAASPVRHVRSASAPFEISSAHHYELVGTYRFATEFWNMRSFNSPTGELTNRKGMFSFEAKSATSDGGRLQITFDHPAVGTDFIFQCEVGNTGQQFEVSNNEAPDVPVYVASRNRVVSSGATLTFDTGVVQTIGKLVTVIKSETAAEDWALYSCEVTPQ